jgi:hypothetical protein
MTRQLFASMALWLVFLLPIIFGTENNLLAQLYALPKYLILLGCGMCGYLAIIMTIAWWNGEDIDE